MQRDRERVRRSLIHTNQAAANLRQRLQQNEAVFEQFIRATEQRISVAEMLERSAIQDTRLDLTDAIKKFESARHDHRVAIFALGLNEGVSIAELGRLFGFSKQLASRIAKEAVEELGSQAAAATKTELH